jgi:TolB-like protein
MRIKSLVVIFLLLLNFCLLAQETATKRTVAVLYFDNNSLMKKDEMEPLSKGLADMLITELSKIEQFQVVERANLQQILEEMKLGQSGAIEGSKAQEVGKMLGAENLILGSYMLMLDGKLRIDARLVEVETGKTLKAEEETGSPKDLSQMVNNLVRRHANNMNVKLSSDQNQALRQSENKSFDAALLYAKGLEYEDAKDYLNARKMYMQALKLNPKFIRARSRLQALRRN